MSVQTEYQLFRTHFEFVSRRRKATALEKLMHPTKINGYEELCWEERQCDGPCNDESHYEEKWCPRRIKAEQYIFDFPGSTEPYYYRALKPTTVRTQKTEWRAGLPEAMSTDTVERLRLEIELARLAEKVRRED